jgi:hypothetical protein
MSSSTELEQQKNEKYELANKKTIKAFGEEKCMKVYEMAGDFIPFKPNQKYKTWQEQIAAELSVSEDMAMDLWDAGNYIVQKDLMDKSKDIIAKFGKDKCKAIHDYICQITNANPSDWIKITAEKHNISESDALEIMMAGMAIKTQDSAAGSAEAMRSYHKMRHKLPSCPKKTCDGTLHEGVSQSEEFNGLFFCDTCQSKFKKKK